jgi:hypothetical protein
MGITCGIAMNCIPCRLTGKNEHQNFQRQAHGEKGRHGSAMAMFIIEYLGINGYSSGMISLEG